MEAVLVIVDQGDRVLCDVTGAMSFRAVASLFLRPSPTSRRTP
ncbi:hypothetical protein [Nonomuraea monospora]